VTSLNPVKVLKNKLLFAFRILLSWTLDSKLLETGKRGARPFCLLAISSAYKNDYSDPMIKVWVKKKIFYVNDDTKQQVNGLTSNSTLGKSSMGGLLFSWAQC
jgi:hypothetical protein